MQVKRILSEVAQQSSLEKATSSLARSYCGWVDYWDYRWSKLRYSRMRKLSKKSMPLFLRGSDIISIHPLANGVHEPEVIGVIEHFALSGFSDFLLDIGANIGLTSCQSGRHFRQVHAFEPNPDILSVFRVNSRIAEIEEKCSLHEYGLGRRDESLTLMVPRGNWGGAFVLSDENRYSLETLARKDGFEHFDEKNYLRRTIELRDARTCLRNLWKSLADSGLCCGVVKLDVEGFEEFILTSILETIPAQFRVAVIFENWSSETGGLIQSKLGPRASLFSIQRRVRRLPWAGSQINHLVDFLYGGYRVSLKPIESGRLPVGNCVLTIEFGR